MGTISAADPIANTPAFTTASGAHPSAITGSVTTTVTVPAGNTGAIRFNITNAIGATVQWSYNAGGFGTIVDGDTTTVFSADTIRFKLSNSGSSAGTVTVAVFDQGAGKVMDTQTFTVS